MKRPRSLRRGYVLMVTLLLLATATLALISAGRASLRLTLHAKYKREDLQRRWGMISCRYSLLPRAAELLDQAEKSADRPLPSLSADLALTNQRFVLKLSDEQAKLNANFLLEKSGKTQAEKIIQDLLNNARCDTAVRLRPLVATLSTTRDRLPLIGSLSQAMPDFQPTLVLPEKLNRQVTPDDLITCWGNGKLHYSRAPAVALAASCVGVLSRQEALTLTNLRKSQPRIKLVEAVRLLNLTEAKRKELSNLLTDHSECYSLCTESRSETRDWRELAVAWFPERNPDQPIALEARASPPQPTRVETLTW